MLTGLAVNTSDVLLFAAYVIFGIGFGLVNAPITNTAVSGMPISQAGVAAAIASTSRQVGSALGVAIVGSAVTSALHGPIQLGFATASHAGWWIVAGCGAAVLGLGLLTTGRWARATADRTASQLMPAADRVPAASPAAR
jgi:MFS family permease